MRFTKTTKLLRTKERLILKMIVALAVVCIVTGMFLMLNNQTRVFVGFGIAAVGVALVVWQVGRIDDTVYAIELGHAAADQLEEEQAEMEAFRNAPKTETVYVPLSQRTKWQRLGALIVYAFAGACLIYGLLNAFGVISPGEAYLAMMAKQYHTGPTEERIMTTMMALFASLGCFAIARFLFGWTKRERPSDEEWPEILEDLSGLVN